MDSTIFLSMYDNEEVVLTQSILWFREPSSL